MVHYWTHFRDVRHQVRKVVEIGVQTPASLLMWEEFFPNATIFGLDVDPACERYTEKRRMVFIGDQKDPVFLKQFIKQTGGEFDIIMMMESIRATVSCAALCHCSPLCRIGESMS